VTVLQVGNATRSTVNMRLSTAFIGASVVCGLLSPVFTLRALCSVRRSPESYWHVFTRGPLAKGDKFTPTGWRSWQRAKGFIVAAMVVLVVGWAITAFMSLPFDK
jgi:hypothetical protein